MAFIQWLLSLFKLAQNQLPESPKELLGYMDQNKLRLAIIVGHEKKSPGAKLYGTNMYEYQFHTKTAQMMAEEAKRTGRIEPIVIFRDGIGIEGTYKKAMAEKCDVAIELHFNAYNGEVAGTSTLCSPDNNDIEFAHIIQNAMCRVFNRNGLSRGVRTLSRGSRGSRNVFSFPNGYNCLIEPVFGDNPKEAKMLIENQYALAVALVQAVLLWAQKKDMV